MQLKNHVVTYEDLEPLDLLDFLGLIGALSLRMRVGRVLKLWSGIVLDVLGLIGAYACALGGARMDGWRLGGGMSLIGCVSISVVDGHTYTGVVIYIVSSCARSLISTPPHHLTIQNQQAVAGRSCSPSSKSSLRPPLRRAARNTA